MRLQSFPALLPILAAPLCFAPAPQGVTVEAGTKITKTFSNALSLELVDISFSVDGEEQEIPEEAKPEVSITDEEEIVFTDEYVSVSGGRGTEILRTFSELSDVSMQTVIPPGGEEMEESEEGESALLDATVRFVWDDEEEGYTASFPDDEEGDEDLLEDLEGDADYLYLLSGEELEDGATWDIDLIAFDHISSPGGDLQIVDPESDEEQDEAFSEAFRDNLDGEMRGTVESIEDGVAKIVFSGEISTIFDITTDSEGEESTQAFDFEFEIAGQLLWDMERGIAKEFQFGGDVAMSLTNEMEMQGAEIVQVQSFEGTYESAAIFE